jgi:hypothetical protein
MSEKKAEIKYKLTDPITILGILLTVNYLIILVLFFTTPIYRIYSPLEGNVDNYYWNGYYETRGIASNNLIDSGVASSFPQTMSNIVISALVICLVISLIQTILPFIGLKIKRKDFLTVGVWFIFLGNGLLLSGAMAFIDWRDPIPNQDSIARISNALLYGIIVSTIMIFLLLLVIGYLIAITDQKIRKKTIT